MKRFFSALYYLKQKDLGYQIPDKPLEGRPFETQIHNEPLEGRPFETQIHKIRDGLAVLELCPLLYDSGYKYGGAILNVPKVLHDHLGPGVLQSSAHKIDSGDLVLLCTRPPLDEEFTKRRLFQSGCPLEQTVLKEMRNFFNTCSRSEIIISDSFSPQPDMMKTQDLQGISFDQSKGGKVKKLGIDNGRSGQIPGDAQLTIGYLVSVPSNSSHFRIVASFGPGGTETLWWSYLLRTQYSGYFKQALESQEACIWTLPFLVPTIVPFPAFTSNSIDFKPAEYEDVVHPICWTKNG